MRKTTALYVPSLVALVKTEPSFVATVLKRLAAGPDWPMASMASIPALTAGVSSVADAVKTRTLTFSPPGGDGRLKAAPEGSGSDLALAAVPPSSDAAIAPVTRATAIPRLDLDR